MGGNLNWGQVKNRHNDYLIHKTFISAWDMVGMATTTTGLASDNGTVPLSVNGVGTPTYVLMTGGANAQVRAIRFVGSTLTANYRWRVPNDVDNQHPIYIRPHWSVSTIGTTLSVTWQAWYATITNAYQMATSPTTVLDTAIPVDSNGSSSVQYVLNVGEAGAIRPLATGINAYQTTGNNVEYIHWTLQPSTTTNILLGTNSLYLHGFDLEYTPRRLWGGPSAVEGRKTETNLGWEDVGAANDY